MATIELGSVFYTTKDNKKGTIVQVNDKSKTAIIEMEDGSTKAQSFTTFKDKRRWIPGEVSHLVPMPGIEKLEELKAEYTHVEELSDEEYAQVGLEIAEQAKEKAKKVKEESGIGFDIKDFIITTAGEMGLEICESNGRFVSFKVNGKMIAGLFSYSKKSATIGVRSKATENLGFEPTSTLTHSMDHRFKFESLTLEDKRRIKLLLEESTEYQRSK